ncbi:MAG TPA: inositol monophosphatase family protein [Dehalococcoidia bacterium]|nr:inositol monophosphatase family protein [Dehalococcoidia bacterium]
MIELPIGTSGRHALDIAAAAAHQAGKILRDRFTGQTAVQYKGKGNVVSEADLAADAAIRELLQAEFPDHGLLSEEGETDLEPDGPFTWIVDPLDGSLNYATGIGLYSVSVALAAGNDLVAGALYDPTRDELFTAAAGRGAFLNGERIAVSPQPTLDRATIGMDIGYPEESRRQAFDTAVKIRPYIQTVRTLGSSALGLAYAGCGRFGVYYHFWLFPWDVAAAELIVREAGGLVTDWAGRPVDYRAQAVVAGSPALHRLFLEAVRAAG